MWTQSRFVLRDEEGKLVVHSDWTCSFCHYTFFRQFSLSFDYHAGLGKDCCCQKFTITMSTPDLISSTGAHVCVFYFIIILLKIYLFLNVSVAEYSLSHHSI